MNESLPSYKRLSIAELHRRLEKEVQAYQRSERLICFYLLQIKRRHGHEDFGFANIEDYALEVLRASWNARFAISTGEQSAVVARAMEICRRMAGEEIDPGRCLDLICGEFLATYEYMAEQDVEIEEAVSAEVAESQCPEGDALPPTTPVPYTKTQLEVLERDLYRCQYPGCSVMCGLHVHHIEFRSHTGKKSRAESNSPANLITTCFVHHRMIHAGNIGLTGRVPAELDWRRPELMESAAERFNELAADAFEPDDFELPGQEQSEPEAAAPA